MDPASVFPSEIFEEILIYLNGESVNEVCLVCKNWLEFINGDSYLWKRYCKHFNSIDIETGLTSKLTWKEIFFKYKEKYELIRRWEKGLYNNISNYESLSENFICELDADTWGYLLDLESENSSTHLQNRPE